MPRNGTGKTSFKDLTGLRFGTWTAIQEAPKVGRNIRWICRCDCGTERSVLSGHLRHGTSRGCGCSKPRGQNSNLFKHGKSETPEFRTWLQMHTRCYNQKSRDWESYGARGIRICAEWKDDFLAFLKDMGPKPSTHHSIERNDVNGHYEPGNCRWATKKEQARNTSRTRWVIYSGRRMSLAEACERSGTPYATAQDRIAAGRGWDEGNHGF